MSNGVSKYQGSTGHSQPGSRDRFLIWRCLNRCRRVRAEHDDGERADVRLRGRGAVRRRQPRLHDVCALRAGRVRTQQYTQGGWVLSGGGTHQYTQGGWVTYQCMYTQGGCVLNTIHREGGYSSSVDTGRVRTHQYTQGGYVHNTMSRQGRFCWVVCLSQKPFILQHFPRLFASVHFNPRPFASVHFNLVTFAGIRTTTRTTGPSRTSASSGTTRRASTVAR